MHDKQLKPKDCIIAFINSDFIIGLKRGTTEAFFNTAERHANSRVNGWTYHVLGSPDCMRKFKNNAKAKEWYNKNVNQLAEIRAKHSYKS